MQKLYIFIPRFALGLAIAALPAAVLGQLNSMPSDSSTAMNSNSTSGSGSVSASDEKFVREAAEGGMAEIALGELATEKASSDEVKKFGQRMVDDHSRAADELKEIASSKGIRVPDRLSAKDRMTKYRLSKLSGEQFDRAYMSDMVKDHTEDVADFKLESSSGTDPDVKHFAATTLPTLQDHLRQAKEIAPTTRNASNDRNGGVQ
jgi:putative membrane protein